MDSMTGAMRGFALAAALAVPAAVALAACGGSSTTTVTASATTQASTPTQTSTSTPTQTATSKTTSTSPRGGGNGAGGGTSSTHIAVYHPSTIVRHNGFVTVIASPDSVGKVAAFYRAQLAKGGWKIREASVNSFHAVFNATRDHEGATIVVHPQGSGSGATITEHPG
jgi:hypothetical protein